MSATRTVRDPTELASQLRLAVMRLSRRLRQHSPADITASQVSLLSTLVREGPMTSRDLAAAERIQPPTVTRIVDSLVECDLVTRTTDEHDRRVSWVAASPAGRAFVESIRRRRDAYLAQRLRTLHPDDLAALATAAELLERLLEDPEP